MTTYRSLVGGFFADPDKDTDLPASIRYNNPGAINGNAAWVQQFQGFVKTVTIGGGNPIAVFETPEQGVALWVSLLERYRKSGAVTLNQIITRYGGGQDYSAYVQTVAGWAALSPDVTIDLDDDDTLLDFAKAMFRYEAGKPSPLSDKQITYGFELARGHEPEEKHTDSFWEWLIELIKAFLNLWHVPQPKPKAPKSSAPWVDEVRKCTGIKETVNGDIILSWRKDFAKFGQDWIDYVNQYKSPTGQPWCGYGLGAAFARVNIKPPFGPKDTLKFMWADSYAHDWGVKLDKPIPGCIGVRTRNGGGHVTMIEKYGDGILYCRGFNQSDAVTVARYALDDKWTGFYWPKGYPIVDVEPDISNAIQAGKET